MEPLICKLPRLISGGGIDSGTLAVLLRNFLNVHDCFSKLLMHCTVKDRMTNVVAQIERTNEQDVYPWNLCNGI